MRLILDQIFCALWYLEYPPNNSSPPSPLKQTVTLLFANSETKKVGTAEGSPKGSSNKVDNLGIVFFKSFETPNHAPIPIDMDGNEEELENFNSPKKSLELAH